MEMNLSARQGGVRRTNKNGTMTGQHGKNLSAKPALDHTGWAGRIAGVDVAVVVVHLVKLLF